MSTSAFYESHLSNKVIKFDFTRADKNCMMGGSGSGIYSLHDASSEPSAQSLFPSHIHASGMHSPMLLLHVKSSDEHTFAST